jgi:hypothetical protein
MELFQQVQRVAEELVAVIGVNFIRSVGHVHDVRKGQHLERWAYMANGIASIFHNMSLYVITPWGMWKILDFDGYEGYHSIRAWRDKIAESFTGESFLGYDFRSSDVNINIASGLHSVKGKALIEPVFLELMPWDDPVDHASCMRSWNNLIERMQKAQKEGNKNKMKKITFHPLRNGWFRCIQTKKKLKRGAVDAYRRTQEKMR